MLAREQQREAAGRGLLQLHPGWMQLVTATGAVLYVMRCVLPDCQGSALSGKGYACQVRLRALRTG
eukprot:1158969-Pelagomonas_calceolata.AAC.1